jgi:hypothetical protein
MRVSAAVQRPDITQPDTWMAGVTQHQGDRRSQDEEPLKSPAVAFVINMSIA